MPVTFGKLMDKEGEVWRGLGWADRTTALGRESLRGCEPRWWQLCLMGEQDGARWGRHPLHGSSIQLA